MLTTLDWAIVAAFFALTLGIGLLAGRKGGGSSREFFLSGRDMPWWLLGVSMVATTFAIDTPNLVANIVRTDGVSGNWTWWALLLSGMVTVFVFAKLWRRAGVMTDVEFYELRYSGKSAAFLRGFRALYLGLIFNVLVMGNVSLAAIKFGQIVLDIQPVAMLGICGLAVLAYSTLGGLRSIIFTDFAQFLIAMIGSIWAAVYLIGHERVGGLDALFSQPAVAEKMAIFPQSGDTASCVTLLLIPLTIIWWSSYYPGSEPGGGGYVAQRMFSAKSERHSMGAALFFNIAHIALRPWPWILVALASLVVFPSLESIATAFPKADPAYIGEDSAYPAMLTLLPPGLLGLVAASLIAAFMSTMSTQVNLGASYLVNDFYKRFLRPDASERELVRAARLATVLTLLMGSGLGLLLTDAGQAFRYMLLLGSGTGLIYILRWFWYRINATTEIVAMVASLVIATLFTFVVPQHLEGLPGLYQSLVLTIVPISLTTAIWIATALLTRPADDETLAKFTATTRPGGSGWKAVVSQPWDVPLGLLCAALGCLSTFLLLIATGKLIYGESGIGTLLLLISAVLIAILCRLWSRLDTT